MISVFSFILSIITVVVPCKEWEHANQIFFLKKLTADKGCQYQKVFVRILHANRLVPV